MDPVTALSGSGPAYVFLLVEAMAAAGAKLGLTPDMAMQLARATVAGSGELLQQSSEPASQLRVNVTSPGGTTAEALKVLMAARRHPAGVRQGAGGGLAALEGACGMTRRPTTRRSTPSSRLIAEKGFAEVALRDVAEAADLGLADLYRALSRQGGAGGGLHGADRCRGAGRHAAPDRSRGDRARPAVRRHDAPLRRAAARIARRWRAIRRAGTRDPLLALALAPALRRSMAAMLEAASLPSEGLSGALRQNGLLAIHYAVSRVFDRDETADLSKTMAALGQPPQDGGEMGATL